MAGLVLAAFSLLESRGDAAELPSDVVARVNAAPIRKLDFERLATLVKRRACLDLRNVYSRAAANEAGFEYEGVAPGRYTVEARAKGLAGESPTVQVSAGGSATLNIIATVLGSGSYTNAAEVLSADQLDADDTFGDGAGNDYDSAAPTPKPHSIRAATRVM